jgi:DNA repair protein RecO (recombination protein O)
MENRVIEGLIYKVMPYLESNRLLYTYTPVGKVTLHAKGAQKMTSQLRIASQYLTHINVDIPKKEGLIPVSQINIINDFQHIKNNYESMREVALLLELITQCIDEDAQHHTIFNDLIVILNSPHLSELSLRFILRLLHMIGYDLNVTGDGREVIGFHIPSASLLYLGDNKTTNISMEDLIVLLQLKYTNYDTILTISDIQRQSIKSFLIDYIEYHVQIKIKNR